MQGRIWVESEVGKGSTFFFTAQMRVDPDRSSRRLPEEASILKGVPVLVIDDNATSRSMLTEMLKNLGMKPQAVMGGHLGLSALNHTNEEGEPFRAILLDTVVPGVEAPQLVKQITQNPKWSHCRVIPLLAPGSGETAAASLGDSIEAFLTKPVSERELVKALTTALKDSGPPSADGGEKERDSKRKKEAPSYNILLAEDNLLNQKLAVRLLEREGHRVTVVNNGRQAVEAVEKGSYDFVLMDVQMPEMDGLQATAAIRERESMTGGHVPIVAMTAHALKGDREKCLMAGMDAYVSKPFKPGDLFEVISNLSLRSESKENG